jgi:addiction module HigA family antidote
MKTANALTSFAPSHPGELLREEMKYRDLSQKQLAALMGVSCSVINEVFNGRRAVNAELAILMEAALGINCEMLLNMQSRFSIQTARLDKSLTARVDEIRKRITDTL